MPWVLSKEVVTTCRGLTFFSIANAGIGVAVERVTEDSVGIVGQGGLIVWVNEVVTVLVVMLGMLISGLDVKGRKVRT